MAGADKRTQDNTNKAHTVKYKKGHQEQDATAKAGSYAPQQTEVCDSSKNG